jgi:Flp pilus assembly protein CpaB
MSHLGASVAPIDWRSEVRTVQTEQRHAAPDPPEAEVPSGGRRNLEMACEAFRGRRVWLALVLILVPAILGGIAFRVATSGTKVLVAAREIPTGEVIRGRDLRVEKVRAGGLAMIEAADRERVVGQRAAEPLYPGKVLAPRALTKEAPLAPGEVAIVLALDPEQAGEGLLHPGQQAAVVGVVREALKEPEGRVVAPSVRVAAVRPSEVPGKVEVELVLGSAEEASAIVAAEHSGRIHLVLTGGLVRQ